MFGVRGEDRAEHELAGDTVLTPLLLLLDCSAHFCAEVGVLAARPVAAISAIADEAMATLVAGVGGAVPFLHLLDEHVSAASGSGAEVGQAELPLPGGGGFAGGLHAAGELEVGDAGGRGLVGAVEGGWHFARGLVGLVGQELVS